MPALDTVAILVAVYNGEKYLDALLDSLIAQDYPHFEIHVRDNCSTDTTLSLLEGWQNRHPNKVFIYPSIENIGVIGNFKVLLEGVEAQYFFFCDADDVWHKDKVSLSLAKMKRMEGEYGKKIPLLVHTDLTVTDDKLSVIAPSFWKHAKLNTSDKSCQLQRLLVQNHVTGCTMLINRALKEIAVPIPTNCVMHDWWIALVAACFGHIGNLSSPTMLYRQHNKNDTGAKCYSLNSFLKRKNKGEKGTAVVKSVQTEMLLKRYGDILTDQNRKMIDAYLSIQGANSLKKVVTIVRYGFYKSGFLRNLILNH